MQIHRDALGNPSGILRPALPYHGSASTLLSVQLVPTDSRQSPIVWYRTAPLSALPERSGCPPYAVHLWRGEQCCCYMLVPDTRQAWVEILRGPPPVSSCILSVLHCILYNHKIPSSLLQNHAGRSRILHPMTRAFHSIYLPRSWHWLPQFITPACASRKRLRLQGIRLQGVVFSFPLFPPMSAFPLFPVCPDPFSRPAYPQGPYPLSPPRGGWAGGAAPPGGRALSVAGKKGEPRRLSVGDRWFSAWPRWLSVGPG